MISPTVLEEIKKVNVNTNRVKKLKSEYLDAKEHICAERSHLVTESWKETEGEPLIIRRAKLFQKVMQKGSIAIRDGELIVGSQTKFVRGSSPCIDFASGLIYQIALSEKPTASSEAVEAVLTEEDRKTLLKDARYWKDKSPGDVLMKLVRESIEEPVDDYIKARVISWLFERPHSKRPLDYAKVVHHGINGVLDEIQQELSRLDLSSRGSWEKYEFLKAGIICCEAVTKFANRYAKLARKLASEESNAVRKGELEDIAKICERVPANPARTFREALQNFWLTFLASNLEGAAHTETPGRMDQYLYPFYEKDIREGKITRQEAAELLGCLWVKFNEMQSAKPLADQQMIQSSMFQDVTICGVTGDGKDATNELSFLMLEVVGQIKMPQPPLYLRYHSRICNEVLVRASEINRTHGAGNPAFLNDDVTLIKLVERGVPLAEARNWVAANCVDVYIPGASVGGNSFVFNTVKAFELALHNGKDPKTGKQLGPATGDARYFKFYEELYDAFMKQVEFMVKLITKIYRVWVQARGEVYRQPFASLLLNDCIKQGKDWYQGGVRYPQISANIGPVGHQNVADSFVAIKKLVFEEKKISMGELLDAIDANFENKDEIRQMLLAAPKYGNDDDYADNVFNDVSLDVTRIMWQPVDMAGYHMYIVRGGATAHYWGGKTVGALPDGRKAGEPFADANLSPAQGADVKGPTAVILSATKVNQMEYSMTTLLNMKFTPMALQTTQGINKFISLLKTYFARGGWHIQFNMINRKTLLEAQKHPEIYKDLMVRVAGYSAYFVQLSPQVQNEIIARTEHLL
ncbi:MAG: pyruvate formate lyase family protein [Dehalococcoidia bacterium]